MGGGRKRRARGRVRRLGGGLAAAPRNPSRLPHFRGPGRRGDRRVFARRAAALYAHFKRPDVFGGALAMSSAFFWGGRKLLFDYVGSHNPPIRPHLHDCGGRGAGRLLSVSRDMATLLAHKGYGKDRLLFRTAPMRAARTTKSTGADGYRGAALHVPERRFNLGERGIRPANAPQGNRSRPTARLHADPAARLHRARVEHIDAEGCVVNPLRYRTKNHLGSMYFGVLAAGPTSPEGSTRSCRSARSTRGVSLAFKDFQANFLKARTATCCSPSRRAGR